MHACMHAATAKLPSQLPLQGPRVMGMAVGGCRPGGERDGNDGLSVCRKGCWGS